MDVPGHERFIRNMLAGAHGMDLVLFTVAADDGVMPQTREHLDILHLLGVTRAIVVITKADLASDARIRDVSDEIRRTIADTSLEGAPILPFSFVTGDGLPAVRALIAATLHDGVRPPREGPFRLPIDRAFSAHGRGLIVTGTAVSGQVKPGDAVRRLPGGELLRVRNVEVHNESASVATYGQRIALNLTGATATSIVRGDVISDERITLTCDRFDARVEVRPTAAEGLKDHQRVHVHLGTAERMGKVIPLASGAHVAPGETAYCQITVEQPIQAMRGDRFILRDATAQRTIAGGVVIFPAAGKRKRSAPGLLQRLQTLDRGNDASLVEALCEERGTFALSLGALAELLNSSDDDIRRRFDRLDGVHVFDVERSPHYAAEPACARAKAALHQLLLAWHAGHPLATGLDLEEARVALPAAIPARMFRMLLEELSDEQILVREGSVLRLPDHRIAVPDADRGLVERMMIALSEDPLSPPDAKQLATSLAVDVKKLVGLLRALEKQQTLVSVAPDLYFLRETVDNVREDFVRDLSLIGAMTTAQFRDRYKTSRKYAIPLLEHFDRIGVTVRIGEVRRLRNPTTKRETA